MANPMRGEITAVLDGEERTLVLTLGALAELEAALGAADMAALIDRFAAGRLSAGEAIKVIGAGLRGAGARVTDQEVARMRAEGGAAGFAAIVVRLILATFVGPGGPDPGSIPGTATAPGGESVNPPTVPGP
jgi:hypothetical protein